MPHKHKRKGPGKATDFDLPPTNVARSLSARQSRQSRTFSKNDKKAKNKNYPPQPEKEMDDTPRAFARMMRFQTTGKRPRSGLDDSEIDRASKTSKKRRHGDVTESSIQPVPTPAPEVQNPTPQSVSTPTATVEEAHSVPSNPASPPAMKIRPHERLSDFAARVDQSLPVAGLTSKNAQSRDPLNLKKQRTKHERRLLRLQKQWREEDERRKARQEEDFEDLEDVQEEDALLWGSTAAETGMRKGKKRKMKMAGEEDPWAEIARKRKGQGIEQRGLHDVVQAPPRLERIKARFKDQGG